MQVLKAFIRNFQHNRLYTLLNMLGLAVGLAAFAFILLYIVDEQSFDRHHKHYRQVYRLESHITVSDREQQVAKTSYALGPALLREIPDIEAFVRFRLAEHCFLQAGEHMFYEDEIYYCDSSVFRVFTHPVISGDPETALTEPYSLVMTEGLALKYFGTTDILDSLVYVKNAFPCKVTAVIQDLPENTHLKFTGLISMPSIVSELGETMYNDLNNLHFWALRLFTYVKLVPGSTPEDVQRQFPAVHDKYIAPISERLNGTFRLETSRLDRIHLYNSKEWDLPKGHASTIYILYIIALFILLIAAINYMNLATARSAQKAREVGMRKVLGAHRKLLSWFYISDAIILSLSALVLSLVIIELLLPGFNQITQKSLSFEITDQFPVLITLLLTALAIGFLAGIYPAYYLASFKPTGIFSRVQTGRPTRGTLRKLLIVFQFSIATAMIAASLVIKMQVDFIRNRNLGFNKENMLVIRSIDSAFKNQFDVFRDQVLADPNIVDVTSSSMLPGIGNQMDVFYVDGPLGTDRHLMSLMFVNENFVDVMGLKVLEGRDFGRSSLKDRLQAALINKTAARKLGWQNDAIGKKIHRKGYSRSEFVVVGVVDDIVFSSLYEPIGPIVFFQEESPGDLLCIRLLDDSNPQSRELIESAWKTINPREPLKYNYLSDLINETYAAEFRLNKIILAFAFLALFISVLGLFGLTSFITEKSSKNIGIRKLLGAGVTTIVFELMRNFSVLILVAMLLATPLAWLLLENWLSHFAYRVQLQLGWFIISGLLVLLIAQLTVVSLTIRAALTNPAEVIRYE